MPLARHPPWYVLDDDPTGAQALSGVRILLAWDGTHQTDLDDDGRDEDAVFLLTNSRAMSPGDAYAVVADAARYVQHRSLDPRRILLRADSTLRGHVLDEYRAIRDVLYPGDSPPLLVVPALPAAGRITVGGTHYLARNGTRVALHDTEYAADPSLGYRSARLLDWADERSHGYFAAGNGAEIPLDELRENGPDYVALALARLASSQTPAVCAPDAVTESDLNTIALGYKQALQMGVDVVVRCSPTFVASVLGRDTPEVARLPRAGKGVLVVCGSYVPTSTRQLARLIDLYPNALVELDTAILEDETGAGLKRLALTVSEQLRHSRIAVLATPRIAAGWEDSTEVTQRMSHALASVVSQVAGDADVIVSKGGNTTADLVRSGLDGAEAWVVGPVSDGVMHWRLSNSLGEQRDLVVVPGNVGDDELLASLVAALLAAA
jgi:uncharacterized protein YgbK (DUF1537 family)